MKRTVLKDVLNHCYERTADRGVLFYKVSDHLLYFTVFCTTARKYKVRVLKLVQMADHLHQGIVEEQAGELSAFMGECSSTFSREYNKAVGRKGPLLDTPFGSAFKKGDKKVRSTLVYMDNNPVDRKLVKLAEDYQWNYLAYAVSDHPFSEKLVLRKASMPLRRAIKLVKAIHADGRYLSYALLQKLFHSLPDDRERNQLTDFIIVTYSVIRHQEALRYFGRYEDELTAAHATSGSEYDIQEGFIGKSDAYYGQMTSILLRSGRLEDIHQVFTLPPDEKQELFALLQKETMAPDTQIAAFLHLPVKPRGAK